MVIEKIKYFILTKFNQDFDFPENAKRTNKNVSPEWLELRFDIFRKYCLPSVMNQTNKNFSWLVFFSHNTPDYFKEMILEFHSCFNNFIPIFSEFGAFKLQPYLDVLTDYVDPSINWLITTRLDCDDCLNKNFVQFVFDSLKFDKENYFINFLKGLQYDIVNKLVVKRYEKSNSFLTRVENIDSMRFKTVFELTSHKSASDLNVIVDKNFPNMWLQIIHDDNLLNRIAVKSNPFVDPNFVQNIFSFTPDPGFSIKDNLRNFMSNFLKHLKL